MTGRHSPAVVDRAVHPKVIELFARPPAWEVLAGALSRRRRVLACYHGAERVLCPHVLGFSGRRAKVLAYQCGGVTSAGSLPADPTKCWRSMFVDEIESAMIVGGSFVSATNYRAEHACLQMDRVELLLEAFEAAGAWPGHG